MSMASIELIFFGGCPNAEAARDNLRAAAAAAGVDRQWQEWDQDDPHVPERVRQYGSPTILVNGRDVTGVEAGVAAAACRADGVPSVETIRAALAS